MRKLEMTRDDVNELLLGLIKARSVAAEGDYLELMADWEFLPGLEPWTANPKTVEVLADIVAGKRELTRGVWANLAYIVEKSPSWGIGLILNREVEMPSHREVLLEQAYGFDAKTHPRHAGL